jgi:hypothetical protein
MTESQSTSTKERLTESETNTLKKLIADFATMNHDQKTFFKRLGEQGNRIDALEQKAGGTKATDRIEITPLVYCKPRKLDVEDMIQNMIDARHVYRGNDFEGIKYCDENRKTKKMGGKYYVKFPPAFYEQFHN